MLSTIICLAVAFAGQPAAAEAFAGSDRQQLEQLNSTWLKSLETRDEQAMGAVLADDFVGLYDDTVLSKQQMLDGLKNRPDTQVSWEGLKIEVRGDSAIVSGTSTIRVRRESIERIARYNYADFYARRNGKWRAIGARVLKLP